MLWTLLVAGVAVLLLALHLHHRKVRHPPPFLFICIGT
jgi:hypothetical protein